MTELFIDNKIAYPKPGNNIKLKIENVFFTKSASYTLDVDLPLSITENRKIFGWMNRIDVEKTRVVLDARLVVDNVDVLIGIATVTKANAEGVCVQLLGESSAYNYNNNLNDRYIDELDLGSFSDYLAWDGNASTSLKIPIGIYGDISSISDSVYGHKYEFVNYPIRNTCADIVLNNVIYCKNNGTATIKVCMAYDEPDPETNKMAYLSYVAFQPYLWYVAKKIAEATGFTLADEDNALFCHSFFKRVFIANANTFLELKKILPHWSVNDWWTQVENAFGLVTVIDYSQKKMRLILRKDFFYQNARITAIEKVVEDFSASINDETETDISSGNVGFSEFENGKEDLLSEYILKNAIRNTDFDNINALLSWGKTTDMSAFKSTLFECKDGRQYIYAENVLGDPGFVEVNMFRPRIKRSDTEELDVELKFVPTHFSEHDVQVFDMPPTGLLGSVSADAYIGSFTATILERPDVSELNDTYTGMVSIEDLISGEEEDTDSHEQVEDVIYIALENENNPDTDNPTLTKSDNSSEDLGITISIPRAYLRERVQVKLSEDLPTFKDSPYSLSLIDISGETNLALATIKNGPKINTDVLYTIKFVEDRIPDPNSIFLIRNKKFVCQRLEAEAGSNGLDKLLTGYFYELS